MEDEVCVGDVLTAMAESVVESHTHLLVKNKADRSSSARKIQPKKPPPYIFYRRTLLFTTKIPPPVAPRACTCLIECKIPGDPAVIKCLSCALFDAAGTGLFCAKCFNYSHPWHRAPHVFMSVEKDESLDHALKVAFRDQQIARAEQEGIDLRYMLQDENSKLETLANEMEVEDKLRDAGRRTINLEEKLRQMRKRLQTDIDKKDQGKSYQILGKSESSVRAADASKQIEDDDQKRKSIKESSFTGGFGTEQLLEKIQTRMITNQNIENVPLNGPGNIPPMPPAAPQIINGDADKTSTDNDGRREAGPSIEKDSVLTQSAVKLQKVFKGFQARKAVSLFFAERIVRVYDVYSGRDYYYDRNTGMSSWVPPRLLRSWDVDKLEYLTENPQRTVWACKNYIARRRVGGVVEDINDAADVISTFFLCIQARKKVLRVADAIFRRVMDVTDGSCYYWNTVTNESFWHKPRLFLTQEPPLYVQEESNIRSPRLNREKLAANDNAAVDVGMTLLTS